MVTKVTSFCELKKNNESRMFGMQDCKEVRLSRRSLHLHMYTHLNGHKTIFRGLFRPGWYIFYAQISQNKGPTVGSKKARWSSHVNMQHSNILSNSFLGLLKFTQAKYTVGMKEGGDPPEGFLPSPSSLLPHFPPCQLCHDWYIAFTAKFTKYSFF